VKQKENNFQLVRERSSGPNIIETRRIVLTETETGNVRRTHVTEQMAKITRREPRKRTSAEAENEEPVACKITGEGERHIAQQLINILKHMSGKDFETQCRILARLVDKLPECGELLTKHSAVIQKQLKFTPEQTAALISGARAGDNVWSKFRSASNKTLGFNVLASHTKVKEVRKEKLPIKRVDWDESKEMLYQNKQGDKKRKQIETAVLKVKNLPEYILKIAQSEAENLSHLENGDILKLCYDADAGGGRFIGEFTFLNCKDEIIVLHPFIIYEGTDVRANLEVVFSSFTQQIKIMEGSKININGKDLIIEQFGVFDLCALNCIIGKQNHSATYPDAWTNVSLDHLRNHKGKPHTPTECKDIQFLSLSDMYKNLTHHSVESGENNSLNFKCALCYYLFEFCKKYLYYFFLSGRQRATGKDFGSVVAGNLLPLKDIFHYILPVMHMVMGLGNNYFGELKTTVIDLDKKETNNDAVHQNEIKEDLVQYYSELEIIKNINSNSCLAQMVLLNDIERILLIKEGKMVEAEKKAKENYNPYKSKKKKKDCDAVHCIIFPIDKENNWDASFICTNSCTIHVRCEGLAPVEEDFCLPENYKCLQCQKEVGNDVWLEEALREESSKLEIKINEQSEMMTRLDLKIKHLEESDSQCGQRQRELKISMKKLKLNPARYHGGDFEGKSIQEMLNCSRDNTFSLLNCISDKKELYDKFKIALKILQQVSDLCKTSRPDYNDDQISQIQSLCEQWGQHWHLAFPHLNITPKGHDLIFVLPRLLKEHKSLYMFYKVEEKGEAIHAELNDIQRKIWCIRNPFDRLWKYIERYELRNVLDTTITDAVKRVKK